MNSINAETYLIIISLDYNEKKPYLIVNSEGKIPTIRRSELDRTFKLITNVELSWVLVNKEDYIYSQNAYHFIFRVLLPEKIELKNNYKYVDCIEFLQSKTKEEPELLCLQKAIQKI